MITKEGLFKYQVLNEHHRKNIMILDAIRKKGPIAKSALSKQLGYNIVTLSNYTDEARKKDLIREQGLDVSSGGRKPVLLELNASAGYIIGIDFNKTAIKGVLTDLTLEVISEANMQRPTIEQEDVKKALISLINDLMKNAKIDASKVKFIGIGTYGVIGEKNGTIKNLDEEKGRSRATIYFTDLKRDLEKEFKITTFFGSDASLGAFAERAKNPSTDTDNMLYIYQDIGKGVIIKGEIYCSTDLGSVDMEGVTGALSEEEKLKLKEEASYLRPWASQMSLKGEALKVIESGIGTKIVEILKGDLDKMNDEIIMKAAYDKDDIAIELIEGIGINLGVRIAYLINLFSPRIVIIGGGIEKAGEILFKQIEKTIEKLSLEKPRQTAKVMASTLGERAVSLGAASVGLREIFLET